METTTPNGSTIHTSYLRMVINAKGNVKQFGFGSIEEAATFLASCFS